MLLFWDCEFVGADATEEGAEWAEGAAGAVAHGGLPHLLSLGVVTEDGREFYGVDGSCPVDRASPWVRRVVLPRIDLRREGETPAALRARLLAWLAEVAGPAPGPDGRPEDRPDGRAARLAFVGYCCPTDWLLLRDLAGPAARGRAWLPVPLDLYQWGLQLGRPDRPPKGTDCHHALADARWHRALWRRYDRVAALYGWPGIDGTPRAGR